MKKPLPFHPRAGQVLVGNFKEFSAPEITKVRPVIVISPKLSYRTGLATIVPISTTAPKHDVPYVYALSKNYTPWGDPDQLCWAKCDLVMTASLTRLSAFKIDRRKYFSPQLSPEDLSCVRKAVIDGLGFGTIEI